MKNTLPEVYAEYLYIPHGTFSLFIVSDISNAKAQITRRHHFDDRQENYEQLSNTQMQLKPGLTRITLVRGSDYHFMASLTNFRSYSSEICVPFTHRTIEFFLLRGHSRGRGSRRSLSGRHCPVAIARHGIRTACSGVTTALLSTSQRSLTLPTTC